MEFFSLLYCNIDDYVSFLIPFFVILQSDLWLLYVCVCRADICSFTLSRFTKLETQVGVGLHSLYSLIFRKDLHKDKKDFFSWGIFSHKILKVNDITIKWVKYIFGDTGKLIFFWFKLNFYEFLKEAEEHFQDMLPLH